MSSGLILNETLIREEERPLGRSFFFAISDEAGTVRDYVTVDVDVFTHEFDPERGWIQVPEPIGVVSDSARWGAIDAVYKSLEEHSV